MVRGFSKYLDLIYTNPDKALADSSIALTTAIFTVVEWCLIVGAIRFLGEVFDEGLLRWTAVAMQWLISASVSFYVTYKINALIVLPDRREAPRRFWMLAPISAAIIGVLYGAQTYVIGLVVDAAAVNG